MHLGCVLALAGCFSESVSSATELRMATQENDIQGCAVFTLVLAVLFIPLIFKSTTMRLQFQDNVLSNHAWYFYSVDIQNLCHQIVWTVKLMAKRRCSGLRIFIFCSCEQSYQLFFGPVFRTHLSKDWVCCIQCIPLINFPADSQTSHPLRSPPLKRARLDGQARAPPQVR